MNIRHALLSFALTLNMPAALAQDPHPPAPGHDDRVVLELTPAERAMILEEMRLFLDGLRKVTGALGSQDMPAVADASRALGQKMVHEVPPALRAKLPQAFRQLGFSVHRDFDQIALDADGMKDPSYTLNQLSATLQKCATCHATYQIRTSVGDEAH